MRNVLGGSTPRRLVVALCSGLALLPVLARAQAANYPDHPVMLVSPYTPGSGSDLTARAIAPALQAALGQPVVIENRSGAGGAIGARFVAKAAPDGYTLLLSSASFSVLPALTDANYDPVKDYEAIIMMGNQQMVVVVPPSTSATSLRDLVALSKSKPGQFNYSSAGIGSIGHLQWELLKQQTGADIVHVPFSGTPQALAEVMSGRVQMSLISMPTALPQIKAGNVKALAVQGAQRAPELPNVPTMEQAGFPELRDAVWYIVLAPKGTPRPIIDKLNAAFRRALATPSAREALVNTAGIVPEVSTPEEAAAYLASQVAKWGKVVKSAKIVTTGVK